MTKKSNPINLTDFKGRYWLKSELLHNQKIMALGIEAITEFYRTMAIDELELTHLKAFVTGIDSSVLNTVIECGQYSKTELKTILNFFKDFNLPWEWQRRLTSSNQDLLSHGFKLAEEFPSMYLNLQGNLPTPSDTLEIREQYGDLNEWIKPLIEGFPSNDECEAYRLLNAALLRNGESRLRHFTVFINNEPASSATLFLGGHSVMLHNLATRHQYRRSGFGSALTLHLITVAKMAGYQHCFLDASEDGFPLYKKLGFSTYFTSKAYTL